MLRGMLSSTDAALGGVVTALKAKGMWANAVIAYSADNGGTDRGSNWPLRGSKHSNWEGSLQQQSLPFAALSLVFRRLSLQRRANRGLLTSGGMRAAAFVSGGLVPPEFRGTESHVVMHIADW